MKHIRLDRTLEYVCRIYVFVFLNIYGLGKMLGGQFYTPENIPEAVAATTLSTATNFDLAWTFMGRSHGYILFIGISQLIGSWLLLLDKTKLIGTAILLPIMVNIIVFDIFFLDKYGALASASLYFTMLLYVIIFNRAKVVGAIAALTGPSEAEKKTLSPLLYRIGIFLAIFGLLFLTDQLMVNLLGHGKG